MPPARQHLVMCDAPYKIVRVGASFAAPDRDRQSNQHH
jgi:hypothetical protein